MRTIFGGGIEPDFVKPVAIHLDRDPAVLTLDLTGGRPSIAVMIGGKGPFLFIVDTGAGASLIDSTVAAQLDLRETSCPVSDTVYNTREVLSVFPAPTWHVRQLWLNTTHPCVGCISVHDLTMTDYKKLNATLLREGE
jgi:Aspartyl protease